MRSRPKIPEQRVFQRRSTNDTLELSRKDAWTLRTTKKGFGRLFTKFPRGKGGGAEGRKKKLPLHLVPVTAGERGNSSSRGQSSRARKNGS